jgi:hypothetical protein
MADLYNGAYYGPNQGSCHSVFAYAPRLPSELVLFLGGLPASEQLVVLYSDQELDSQSIQE